MLSFSECDVHLCVFRLFTPFLSVFFGFLKSKETAELSKVSLWYKQNYSLNLTQIDAVKVVLVYI